MFTLPSKSMIMWCAIIALIMIAVVSRIAFVRQVVTGERPAA